MLGVAFISSFSTQLLIMEAISGVIVFSTCFWFFCEKYLAQNVATVTVVRETSPKLHFRVSAFNVFTSGGARKSAMVPIVKQIEPIPRAISNLFCDVGIVVIWFPTPLCGHGSPCGIGGTSITSEVVIDYPPFEVNGLMIL
jgi:hypothetical protein